MHGRMKGWRGLYGFYDGAEPNDAEIKYNVVSEHLSLWLPDALPMVLTASPELPRDSPVSCCRKRRFEATPGWGEGEAVLTPLPCPHCHPVFTALRFERLCY